MRPSHWFHTVNQVLVEFVALMQSAEVSDHASQLQSAEKAMCVFTDEACMPFAKALIHPVHTAW